MREELVVLRRESVRVRPVRTYECDVRSEQLVVGGRGGHGSPALSRSGSAASVRLGAELIGLTQFSMTAHTRVTQLLLSLLLIA